MSSFEETSFDVDALTSAENSLELKARDSGPYTVYVDDVIISNHTTERKASQRAANLALALSATAARVRYERAYVVDVTINAVDITTTVPVGGGVLTPVLDHVAEAAAAGSYLLAGATVVTTPTQQPLDFVFVDETNVPLNDTRISDPVYPIGHTVQIAIEVSGVASSKYSINGGTPTASPGTLNPGDYFQAHHTSGVDYYQDADTTVTLAGIVSDTFTSRTIPVPPSDTDLSQILYSYGGENGTEGNSVTGGLMGISDTNSWMYFDTFNRTGTYSLRDEVKTTASAGGDGAAARRSHGFNVNNLGGCVIAEGDEIWVRYATFFETGFDFSAGTDGTEEATGLKWLALEHDVSLSKGRCYIAGPRGTSTIENDWGFASEPGNTVDGNRIADITNGTGMIKRGVWQVWEHRCKVSTWSNRVGEVDMWRDGIKVATLRNLIIIPNTANGIVTFNMSKYWNGSPPKDQNMWWDDLAWAVKTAGLYGNARDDTVHMARDLDNNPFIGV